MINCAFPFQSGSNKGIWLDICLASNKSYLKLRIHSAFPGYLTTEDPATLKQLLKISGYVYLHIHSVNNLKVASHCVFAYLLGKNLFVFKVINDCVSEIQCKMHLWQHIKALHMSTCFF